MPVGGTSAEGLSLSHCQELKVFVIWEYPAMFITPSDGYRPYVEALDHCEPRYRHPAVVNIRIKLAHMPRLNDIPYNISVQQLKLNGCKEDHP